MSSPEKMLELGVIKLHDHISSKPKIGDFRFQPLQLTMTGTQTS